MAISCELCKEEICKYKADFRACWGIWFEDEKTNQHQICHECAKAIMEELLDVHNL